MVGATVLFAGSSAISKWQVATYPVQEVLFIRTAVSLIACSLFILPQSGLAVFATQRLGAHVKRGVSQFVSQSCIVIALMLMPLATATAISFSAPLFATLFSAWLLKESVGPTRWTVLLVGFVGVLLVSSPSLDALQIGSLFALANAILYATVTVAVRGMTATESINTLTMYQMVILTILFGLVVPFGFIMPSGIDAALLMASGAGNALGQYWWTKSLHLAPASAVTPFYYLSLVWAVIIGFVVWGDMPTLGLIVGSAVVIGSGLFLLWREKRRR